MESQKEYLRPSSVMMTLPDPESKKFCFDGQQGGTFQWRTETHEHPMFEIRFIGHNPSDDDLGKCFRGDDVTPVVIRLNKVGDYQYDICQMSAKGGSVTSGPHQFSVHECKGCPPP